MFGAEQRYKGEFRVEAAGQRAGNIYCGGGLVQVGKIAFRLTGGNSVGAENICGETNCNIDGYMSGNIGVNTSGNLFDETNAYIGGNTNCNIGSNTSL